ncbi:AraC-like DNA-binding protein [Agrobacterium vitis]|nr:AraC-like DNA-binding protein [Agrobacterium vitis]MBE1439170.1 AraC-like DNA-binding protein [Agrobacterium vitis]
MSLTKDYLASSPRFAEALAVMARQLSVKFDESPRLSRALVCHQRWLLTQACFALYADHALSGTGPGMTASSLSDWVVSAGIASRNTAHHYVENLRSYRFIRIALNSGQRPLRYDICEQSLKAMHMWFEVNLAVLDHVDGGNRAERFHLQPDLLLRVQPEFARRCIEEDAWREPSQRIGLLLWTECGALVMDHFLELAVRSSLKDGFYDLGVLNLPALAQRFLMSRTHLQRTLKKAEEHGCIARSGIQRGSRTLLSADFFQEYCGWLAIKSAFLDAAFESAISSTNMRAACV